MYVLAWTGCAAAWRITATWHSSRCRLSPPSEGFLIFSGLVILFYNLLRSLKKGDIAGNNPWEAPHAGMDGNIPAAAHGISRIRRQVVGEPYGYGMPGKTHAILNEETTKESHNA